MVAVCALVECSAKIAMTTLRINFSAMRLLLKDDWPRRIFIAGRATRIR